MANFAGPGFGAGFRSTFGPRQQQAAQRQVLEAERQSRVQSEQAAAFRKQREKLVEDAISTFDEITEAASQAAMTGRTSDQEIGQFREAANGALLSTLSTLQNDIALAIQAGADPNDPSLEEMRRIQQMVASHAPVFDARVEAAKSQIEPTKTPEQTGQEAARERAAEVRTLAEELDLDEDKVAEGLGLVPGQPAPTELEKLERTLRMMDRQNIPDDDPVRLRVLNRLTSMTTPSVADIISPLIQKMARGEELTEAEQQALDSAQRLSFTEQLLRGLVGGGPANTSPGTPSYVVDEDGNLVAR